GSTARTLSRTTLPGSGGSCAWSASMSPVATALLTSVRLYGATSASMIAVVVTFSCWASSRTAADPEAPAPMTRTCVEEDTVKLRSGRGRGALPSGALLPLVGGCSGGDILLRVGVEQGATAGAAQPVASAFVVAEQARGLGDALDHGPALHHRADGHVIRRGAHKVRASFGLHGSVGRMTAAAVGVLVGGVVHSFPSIGVSCRLSQFFAMEVKPRRRRLLPTTKTLEKAIAAPASMGLSMPSAAIGIAAVL